MRLKYTTLWNTVNRRNLVLKYLVKATLFNRRKNYYDSEKSAEHLWFFIFHTCKSNWFSHWVVQTSMVMCVSSAWAYVRSFTFYLLTFKLFGTLLDLEI